MHAANPGTCCLPMPTAALGRAHLSLAGQPRRCRRRQRRRCRCRHHAQPPGRRRLRRCLHCSRADHCRSWNCRMVRGAGGCGRVGQGSNVRVGGVGQWEVAPCTAGCQPCSAFKRYVSDASGKTARWMQTRGAYVWACKLQQPPGSHDAGLGSRGRTACRRHGGGLGVGRQGASGQESGQEQSAQLHGVLQRVRGIGKQAGCVRSSRRDGEPAAACPRQRRAAPRWHVPARRRVGRMHRDLRLPS